MSDTLLSDGCTETGHAPGPHRHLAVTDACAHGTPVRYTCHGCENGLPALQVAGIPADWQTRGLRFSLEGRNDVFVAPSTITALLQGAFVGGGRTLAPDVAQVLVRAGWAESTYRGYRATYALRRIA